MCFKISLWNVNTWALTKNNPASLKPLKWDWARPQRSAQGMLTLTQKIFKRQIKHSHKHAKRSKIQYYAEGSSLELHFCLGYRGKVSSNPCEHIPHCSPLYHWDGQFFYLSLACTPQERSQSSRNQALKIKHSLGFRVAGARGKTTFNLHSARGECWDPSEWCLSEFRRFIWSQWRHLMGG